MAFAPGERAADSRPTSEASLSDDAFLSRLQTTITMLRYWTPSVADAAEVEEIEGDSYWGFRAAPSLPGACPFELVISTKRTYDIAVAGEEYANRRIETLDVFPPLVDAITSGRIRHRVWFSPLTSLEYGTETIADLGGGRTWREAAPGFRPEPGWESDDRWFLPYRR